MTEFLRFWVLILMQPNLENSRGSVAELLGVKGSSLLITGKAMEFLT